MAKRSLSDNEILAQLPAAKRRSNAALAKRARAEAVHVDPDGRLLTVVLTNGSQFSVLTKRVPGLERASATALKRVAIDPVGMGLHWADLDVDHSVSGLAEVVFGETSLLAAAGAAGGRAISKAKAEAARRNGLKGGRPPKTEAEPERRVRKVLYRFRVRRFWQKAEKVETGKAKGRYATAVSSERRSGADRRQPTKT